MFYRASILLPAWSSRAAAKDLCPKRNHAGPAEIHPPSVMPDIFYRASILLPAWSSRAAAKGLSPAATQYIEMRQCFVIFFWPSREIHLHSGTRARGKPKRLFSFNTASVHRIGERGSALKYRKHAFSAQRHCPNRQRQGTAHLRPHLPITA